MSFEEIPLMKSLRNFDVSLAERYVATAQTMLDESLRFEPRIEKISSGGTILGFRFTTTTPIYLMLSHPICRFNSSRPYVVNPTFEKVFFENLGLIPVYLASFNRMSMLKTWGKTTRLFFDPHNSPLGENNPVCWKLGSSDRPPKLSSMNFVLKYSSPVSAASEDISSLMKRYFSRFFWETQDFDISRSTHFLHLADKITGMVNVVKTIFVVKKVCGKHEIEIQGRPVYCYELLVSGIFRNDDGGYHVKNIEVLMEYSVAKELVLDKTERYGFFNGVVTEIKRKHKAMKLFQVIDTYDTNYFELIQDLIGFVCTDRFRKWGTLSNVGTINDVKKEVEFIIDLLTRETKLEMTLGSMLDDWFERALSELFPILLQKNNHLYFVHPLVWSFFEKNRLQYNPNTNDLALQNLITILEKILEISPAKLRMMPEVDSFRVSGINIESLKKEIRKLANNIYLAKTINGNYL